MMPGANQRSDRGPHMHLGTLNPKCRESTLSKDWENKALVSIQNDAHKEPFIKNVYRSRADGFGMLLTSAYSTKDEMVDFCVLKRNI